ncbi:hypothetical protein QFZ99_006111 [Paraburkholderia atlantica]
MATDGSDEQKRGENRTGRRVSDLRFAILGNRLALALATVLPGIALVLALTGNLRVPNVKNAEIHASGFVLR